MSALKKRFYDPLYGLVDLNDFEYSLILLPEVQRLRYIRMCNINSMLITGASEISRFEHVLGVMYLAKEWLSRNGASLSEEMKRSVVAAAVLHDIQTGPFGHSFQYVVEDNEVDESFKHEDLSHGAGFNYHQIADAKVSFSGKGFSSQEFLKDIWKNVVDLIKGHGELGPLISGTIDLDNIDNVVRLAYHAGLTGREGVDVALSLARDIQCFNGVISITQENLNQVSEWQSIRKKLYEYLLLDWAEFSAKAMLTKATELSVENKVVDPESWILTDHEFLNFLKNNSLGENQDISLLVTRLRRGDLYYPVFLAQHERVCEYNFLSSVSVKKDIEAKIKKSFKREFNISGDFIIHFIKDHKKTERAISLFVRDKEKREVVGKDSSRLLIGVFFGSSVKQNIHDSSFFEVVRSVLNEYLTDEFERILDPMMPEAKSELQLELL